MSDRGGEMRFPAAGLAAVLAALAGCGKTITITQYPAFYSPDLQTVAVGPFQNTTPDFAAGQAVAARVASALAANGTYRVVDMTDRRTTEDTQSLLRFLRKKGDVQALLTGTVATYAVTRRIERVPVYAYDRRGRRYVSHYIHQAGYDASVAATARLLRVSDGAVLHGPNPPPAKASTPKPPEDGVPPPGPADAAACLSTAAGQVAAAIVDELAVIRRQVKVSRDALRVALDRRDGKWVGGKEFSPQDERMMVVVDLPAACDRNGFRLTIARKDSPEILAEEGFTWQREWSDAGGTTFEYSPARLAARGGQGEYVVALLSGRDVVLEAKFRIQTPGKGD